MPLPPCHSRRKVGAGKGVYFCAHPRVHAKNQLVTQVICQACSYWKEPPPEEFRALPPPGEMRRDGPCFYLGEQTGVRECPGCRGSVQLKVFSCGHVLHDETTLPDCERCGDYELRLKKGGVLQWAVGVTTAPRKPSTLRRCLASLAAAGWDEVRIFAEPGVRVTAPFRDLPVTRRESTLGAWPNWYLGLGELVLRQPTADAYMIVQDDVVFCRNVRTLLEKVLWPAEKVGIVSVYCPTPYERRTTGLHVLEKGRDLIGALALVFPNASARALLSDAAVVAHRLRDRRNGLRNIDTVAGRFAHRCGLPIYYHFPSLAQHIGDTSTIWDHAANAHHRRASRFAGEDFDALRFCENPGG